MQAKAQWNVTRISFLGLLPLVSLFFVNSCSKVESESSTRLQALADDSGAEELGSSDLSILVPLQSSVEDDPSLSIFGKSGTGICNAPSLDLGGDDPILSESMWQDWAKDSLLSILPLPADEKLWQKREGQAIAARKAALLREMQAIPDVDSDDLCPEPIGIEEINTDEVEPLRLAGTHVATAQTLPQGACRYRNWHVVAARFEPCGFRAKVLRDQPDAFDPIKNPEFPKEECGGAELRLVLQPFIPRPDGGFGSIDMAIHAFYKLNDVESLVQDLRSLRKVTRSSLNGREGSGRDAVWYADQKDMLLPHPGLREEMNCDGNGANGIGPVGTEWQRVLSRHAKESKLFKMTWMTSDNSGGNWSFGLRLVQPDEETTSPRRVVRQEPFSVETFTLSQVAKGFPYTPFDMSLNTVDYFYREGRTDKELSSEKAQLSLKELIDISNPDRTTFNLGGKLGASCASCHTRDQTERAVRVRSGKSHEDLANLAGTATHKFPLWDPIARGIDKRNDNNVRNFGYGPAMSIAVSRRSATEAEVLRRTIKDYFTAPLPKLGPARATVDYKAFPDKIDFASHIAPILETNCGYCHGVKREPKLLNETVAQTWSYSIVASICKEVSAWQHMPPGKVLTKREKDLIVAWAQSLAPSAEPLSCQEFESLLR